MEKFLLNVTENTDTCLNAYVLNVEKEPGKVV